MSDKSKSLLKDMKVLVIKRKLNRKPKTGKVILQEAKKHADPSHESEKAKNPLEYTRASYATALSAKEIWPLINVPARHIHELFGEPTRILRNTLEWCVRLPTREIVKIVVYSSRVSVHGFNRTPTVERWVERLINS